MCIIKPISCAVCAQQAPISQAKPLQSMPNPLRNVNPTTATSLAIENIAHTSRTAAAITRTDMADTTASNIGAKNSATNTITIDTLLSDINFVAMLAYTFHTLFTNPSAHNSIAATVSTVRNAMLKFFPHTPVSPTPEILNTLPPVTMPECISPNVDAHAITITAPPQVTSEPTDVNLLFVTAPIADVNATLTKTVSGTEEKLPIKPVNKVNNIPTENTLESKRRKKPVAKNTKSANPPPIKPLTP